ncbi:Vacuolar fusion protein CCZ1-like protein [Acrodontium crateriforme]|uniref:Vacuolar fusion protein CCZ1-like protein n=1 Tax=Acrodontium crateriforme TaxID=150365 RepID=A0AAQ3RA97_9PEZI|nr:Vacuolar fusion protein CCZ1-like protein [Acrodontium crateriforme]
MTTSTTWPPRVVPAQLAFLAIYNPSLGPTDDTFRDQLLFYYSRSAHEARVAAKRGPRRDETVDPARLREAENEKLRQIGLAQGMVNFARSFADGSPVDSVETEKSRIVLHELESGWWILASIDLTQLPVLNNSTADQSASKKGAENPDPKPTIEYSSREVAPPALLISQLLQTHYIFGLHHGQSLSHLYGRLTKSRFCNILERFWGRFAKNWDVLLHGNPAADIFSGLKVASGGELGFGVGEEEWGSGEREVLEDLVHRTEGLEELVVARFGEPDQMQGNDMSDHNDLPWIGNGNEPLASDGIIFGGVGAISRFSLRNVSLWMRHIYTYGDHGYGVRDNPHRERRKQRRRNVPEPMDDESRDVHQSISDEMKPKKVMQNVQKNSTKSEIKSELQVEDERPRAHERTASQDYTQPRVEGSSPKGQPSIPPPIVAAVEQSLDSATIKASQDGQRDSSQVDDHESGTTMGIPDQYMKYLTFGLSTLGRSNTPRSTDQNARSQASSTSGQDTKKITKSSKLQNEETEANPDLPLMKHVHPLPDGETLASRIAKQKRMENKGHFLIGLKGDVDEMGAEEAVDGSDASSFSESGGSRNVLRTLQIEMTPTAPSGDSTSSAKDVQGLQRNDSDFSATSVRSSGKDTKRLRVVVYLRRPFMYCFLFQDRTVSLQYADFYKDLHWNLNPIHKPLLSSTSVAQVSQRIEASHERYSDTTSVRSNHTNTLPSKGSIDKSEIYDLIFDPRTLTLHTSIPNIPEPGTPAAEGLSTGRNHKASPREWTRLDALNVHSQILNSLASVRSRPGETERSSKTSRGWWIVWMKIPPSAHIVTTEKNHHAGDETSESTPSLLDDETTEDKTTQPSNEKDLHRTAFLVRKSSDAISPAKPSAGSRVTSGMFQSLGLARSSTADDRTGGASAGWGPGALAGGMGFDARVYVEGLLSLNR